MRIDVKESFKQRLLRQIDYIAQDSPTRARKFQKDIINRIKKIPERPYSYRKSIYFDDEKGSAHETEKKAR